MNTPSVEELFRHPVCDDHV